ncbi:uncharacterized protein LOC129291974 [Prosopis cineraria]|uniref:uncharacterized protein LOC129291974 n=1 Tax=Prosopis cineraria TaxID=364024 RepID=UPI0024102C5C|nr:uncharacterized protein LOC129291974 [Prosopis cineraria]
MASNLMHVICLITFLAGMQATQAVEYTVINTALAMAGGVRFNNETGTDYARQTLDAATQFIWGIFQQQNNASDRKDVQKVRLIVEDINGVAYTSKDEIHLSARYVGNYSGDVRREVSGVLYHEMTHVWQWNGKGEANGGLIEGVADFVRLKAGYGPSHWVKAGEGDRWDHGYDVTAHFLDYCESLRSGFVAELNKKMRNDYSDQFFAELLGKSVDQLWNEYKAKYGN